MPTGLVNMLREPLQIGSFRPKSFSDFNPTAITPICHSGYAMKPEASMTSTRSTPETEWPGRRIDMRTFAERLTSRRAALGNPELPRNSGKNRTPSKIALLKAIEDAGGRW